MPTYKIFLKSRADAEPHPVVIKSVDFGTAYSLACQRDRSRMMLDHCEVIPQAKFECVGRVLRKRYRRTLTLTDPRDGITRTVDNAWPFYGTRDIDILNKVEKLQTATDPAVITLDEEYLDAWNIRAEAWMSATPEQRVDAAANPPRYDPKWWKTWPNMPQYVYG